MILKILQKDSDSEYVESVSRVKLYAASSDYLFIYSMQWVKKVQEMLVHINTV